MVTVYQFERFDPLLKHVRRSDYFATDDAIEAFGAHLVPDTGYDIDEQYVDPSGLVRPRDMAHAVRHVPPPSRRGSHRMRRN